MSLLPFCPVVEAATTLSPGARRWRVVITVFVLGLLLYGSIAGSDQDFPLGPMTQYAFYVPPNGTVVQSALWADTTAGTHVRVPLDPSGVGIRHGELEQQLPAIQQHPERLQAIVTAQRRLHPHQPQYVRLYVVLTIYPLRDRVPLEPVRKTVLTWTVPR